MGFEYKYVSLKMTKLPLKGIIIMKANDEALTKVIGDKNCYGYAWLFDDGTYPNWSSFESKIEKDILY